ncbi:MAG: 3-deoxy-manno-octulosonate cytidylyltransferase [Limisphaera sp.]|nr:MAG: 3-deoxy-manno-octulosonate cytidylyltransferase [Limisphaera sp.]
MKTVGIIPARYGSTRFPGKPLVRIAGKPLLQHVVERARRARRLAELIVATDDERIARVAEGFCRVAMTRPDHPSGTDRVAEVARRLACEGVVNIQGDEPLVDPVAIDAVAEALETAEMSTAATPLTDPRDLHNPNVVKVVVSRSGRALYFSRYAIPFVRGAEGTAAAELVSRFGFLRHLGLYGYRRETLLQLVQWPVSALEEAEKLEQLRALENDVVIRVVQVTAAGVGVDVPEDVVRVEALLAGEAAGPAGEATGF